MFRGSFDEFRLQIIPHTGHSQVWEKDCTSAERPRESHVRIRQTHHALGLLDCQWQSPFIPPTAHPSVCKTEQAKILAVADVRLKHSYYASNVPRNLHNTSMQHCSYGGISHSGDGRH